MRMIKAFVMIASILGLAETGAALLLAPVVAESAEPNVAVGPQYDSTHVYVAPEISIASSRASSRRLAERPQIRWSPRSHQRRAARSRNWF